METKYWRDIKTRNEHGVGDIILHGGEFRVVVGKTYHAPPHTCPYVKRNVGAVALYTAPLNTRPGVPSPDSKPEVRWIGETYAVNTYEPLDMIKYGKAV